MKKLINISVLVLAISYTAFSQTVKDRARLKGTPKSVKIEVINVSEKAGKFTESARIPAAEYVFDSNGHLNKSTIYKHDGSVYAKYVASRDDKGNKKEEAYYSPKDKLVDKLIYKYDASGRMYEKVVEKSKTSPQRTISLRYDDAGRIAVKIYNAEKDKPPSKVIYSYDESNRKIEQRSYDATGSLTSTRTTIYDAQGRLLRVVDQFTKPYSGNWSTELAYDSNGNVSEEKFYLLDSVSIWRYQYELDQNGNWIKRSKFLIQNNRESTGSQPVEITYRTIAYHPASESSHKGDSASLAAIVAEEETSSYLPTEAVKRPEPRYPELAKQARIGGIIRVLTVVDEKGEVDFVKAFGHDFEPLQNAAEAAALHWKFNPVVLGGYIVRSVGTLTFNFTL